MLVLQILYIVQHYCCCTEEAEGAEVQHKAEVTEVSLRADPAFQCVM